METLSLGTQGFSHVSPSLQSTQIQMLKMIVCLKSQDGSRGPRSLRLPACFPLIDDSMI